MSQLQEFFQFLIAKVREKEDLKKQLAEWVGPYHGKVLQVYTEDGPQYIVVTKEGMSLHDGVYPSPDVIYKASAQTLLAIFIGNAHESNPLANLILAAMMSM
ncbi:MAG: hypothetical protein ACTSPE_11420 [Candidatus Thorarchaeota archaeon]